MYMYIYIRIYIYIYMYICKYVYVYVYIYMYMVMYDMLDMYDISSNDLTTALTLIFNIFIWLDVIFFSFQFQKPLV